MLGYCDNCKRPFEYRNAIVGGPGFRVTSLNSTTSCPYCGKRARFLDGTFEMDKNGMLQLLSGPDITVQIVDQLRKLTEKAIEENQTREEFIESAAAIHPALALLNQFLPTEMSHVKNGLLYLLALLIPLLYDHLKDDKPQVINNYNFYSVPQMLPEGYQKKEEANTPTNQKKKLEKPHKPPKGYQPKVVKPTSKSARVFKGNKTA